MSKSEKEFNTISFTLGIIGTIIGVLALLGAWIPALGLATIPYSIIGICLSGAGIGYAFLKNYKAIELPILGILICFIAIAIPITSTYLAAAAVKKAAKIAAEQAREHAAAEKEAQQQMEKQYRENQISEFQIKIPMLKIQCAVAEEALELAQSNFDSEKTAYELFVKNRPYLTNEVYVKICRELTATYPSKTYWEIQSLQRQLQEIVYTATQFHLSKIDDAQNISKEDQLSPSGSKPARGERFKTGHSEVLDSYHF